MNELIDYFETLSPVTGAFYATLFTWGVTALGASLVFFFKGMNRKVFDAMLGFTGGVMVAASFWSLLAPGIEMSPGEGFVKVIPAAVGFALGASFLFGLDKVLPHLHVNFKMEDKDATVKFKCYISPPYKYTLCCRNKYMCRITNIWQSGVQRKNPGGYRSFATLLL